MYTQLYAWHANKNDEKKNKKKEIEGDANPNNDSVVNSKEI